MSQKLQTLNLQLYAYLVLGMEGVPDIH